MASWAPSRGPGDRGSRRGTGYRSLTSFIHSGIQSKVIIEIIVKEDSRVELLQIYSAEAWRCLRPSSWWSPSPLSVTGPSAPPSPTGRHSGPTRSRWWPYQVRFATSRDINFSKAFKEPCLASRDIVSVFLEIRWKNAKFLSLPHCGSGYVERENPSFLFSIRPPILICVPKTDFRDIESILFYSLWGECRMVNVLFLDSASVNACVCKSNGPKISY